MPNTHAYHQTDTCQLSFDIEKVLPFHAQVRRIHQDWLYLRQVVFTTAHNPLANSSHLLTDPNHTALLSDPSQHGFADCRRLSNLPTHPLTFCMYCEAGVPE